MGVVIGKMDGQVEKIFLGNNLTRSTKNYAKILKDKDLSEEEKTKLTDNLTTVIAGITAESDIENMIKAKGFPDCVAFVDGEKVNISVQTGSDGLDAAAVAQIRDIVLSKMETSAKNITIVEVK